MSLFVKICGLTDADAVTAAVDGGADAVGFVFAESVREITPQRAAKIAAAVPGTVLRVAVMLQPTNERWQQVWRRFRPDVLQTDYADFPSLDIDDDVARWPVLREGGVAEGDELPDTFIYEGRSSGRGETVERQFAARLARRGRMILAGGLSADNVAQAVAEVSPYGVDVSSAVESSPGTKDPAMIRAFIDAAKTA